MIAWLRHLLGWLIGAFRSLQDLVLENLALRQQLLTLMHVCMARRDAAAGSRESRGDCPATTDEAGQFRIDHVAMGRFGVEAIKPEDGYIAFAGTSVKEMVTLTPSQSSATVVLKLGPKPGVLLPSVKDKFTGEPVRDFQVNWAIFDSDEADSISGGQAINRSISRAIVPPEKYLVNHSPRLQEMGLPRSI
jgi:hypothetical protein